MIRRIVLAALALALAGWGGGFAWFVHVAHDRPPSYAVAPGTADGIVALTGGADRVARALQLLVDGAAPRLLVSGVGHGTDVATLAHAAGLDPATLAERVVLGHTAETTAGNAEETAAWARAHGLHSLLVVTAGYHMPRALLELGRMLPDVTMLPVPVQPPAMRGRGDPAVWRLLAGEYTKYLLVRLGVAPLLRRVAGKGQWA